MKNDQMREIIERLDMIVKIMSIRLTGERDSPKDQIKDLLSVGMTPSQIGRILGKPTNVVTAYQARIKKSKKGKKDGK